MIIDHGREFPGAAFVQSTVKEFASKTGDTGILCVRISWIISTSTRHEASDLP
jgi:hypothetical protein